MRRDALEWDGTSLENLGPLVQLAFDRAFQNRIAFDRATARRTDYDGRLHVSSCRISKANVCPYYGREIPNQQALGLDPNKIYKLYRDPAELEKAAPTFRNLQLLMQHTKVDAKDPKKVVTVGTVGSGISFDGNYLVADHLTVWADDGIKLIETEEARELSCSYHYRADMTPGINPEGVAYDGVMRDIKGNHVALVRYGRAGRDVLVNDALPLELRKMKRKNLLARLIALKVLAPGTYEKEQLLALDEKLAELTAQDADAMEEEEIEEEGEEGDDPEKPRAKKKGKMNPGKGKAGKAGGAMACDTEESITQAVEDAVRSGGYVSREDAQKLANDAANNAVARVNALHTAREVVKPLVGIVAMDSADAVYKFALEQEKVSLDGVPEAAYPALVAQVIARKSGKTPAARTAIPADTATAVAQALPGLGRIQRAA